jgi:hypothetical protein
MTIGTVGAPTRRFRRRYNCRRKRRAFQPPVVFCTVALFSDLSGLRPKLSLMADLNIFFSIIWFLDMVKVLSK